MCREIIIKLVRDDDVDDVVDDDVDDVFDDKSLNDASSSSSSSIS